MITLICEDDPLIARDIMEEMEAAGLKAIGPARDTREAMMAAQIHDISIAVVDVTLRDGRTGVDLARALHESGCAIIIYSANFLPPEELSDLEHKFVRKPAPPGAIVDCVRASARGHLPPNT